MADFQFNIPITKVDMQKREVWGRATQEIVDGHDEIMDYDTSKPLFSKWSDNVMKRSQGKSKGNVREMHQPIAAGKLIAMQFNDGEKAVDVGAYVSDNNSWQKVLDGVLTGFSIGGDYAKRWMDRGKTRYTADPHEISLVDAPAVPTAVFQLVKIDGSTELKKFANYLPLEVEVNKAEGEVAPLEDAGVEKFDNIEGQIPDLTEGVSEVPIEMGVTEGARVPEERQYEEVETDAVIAEINPDNPAGVVDTHGVQTISPTGQVAPVEKSDTPPAWVGAFKEYVKQFSDTVEKLDTLRKQEVEKLQKVDAELKLRGSRVGIARREGEPVQPLKDYPSDWMQYADPANWSFPMTKSLAGVQVAAYNKGSGREKYSPSEWMVLGRRITRMASNVFGVPYRFSPTDKQVERTQVEKAMNDKLQKQSDPMSLLREVSAQLSAACDTIATDPGNAMTMLTRTLGLIDTVSDVSPANPATQAEPPLEMMAKADAAMKCTKCGGSIGKSDAFCAKCGKALEKAASIDESPASEAVAKEDDVNDLEKEAVAKAAVEKYVADQAALAKAAEEKAALEKAQAEQAEKSQSLEDLVKAQSEAMIKMQANLEAIAKGQPMLPAGDVPNAIAEMREEENPLLKALNEGNLAKAYEVVGHDNVKLYDQLNTLAVQQIYKTGINVQRFGFIPAFQVDEETAKQ